MAIPTVPPQDPPYDFTPLLARCERAALILRNPEQGEGRYSAAARVLCDFFRVLDADTAFWTEVERLAGDQPAIRGLFATLEDFEDQEYELLTQAGVDELAAAELAGDFKIQLERYQPGALPALQRIRDDVRRLGDAVCEAETHFDHPEADLGNPPQKRRRLKLLSRALYVAAALVGVGVNIASAGVASVVTGLMTVAAVAAEALADGASDG